MGKIGKPQKSGKAKKIKAIDPFYKGDRKDSLIKHKDQRPQNEDSQEFPRKVRRMMEAVSDMKKTKSQRKKIKKAKVFREREDFHPTMTKPLDSIPKFKQKAGESEYRFMNRIERETSDVIQQSKLEQTYKMKFSRDKDGDLIPIKSSMSEKKKKRLKDRREKKKNMIKEKRQEKDLEFGTFKDEVKFGEVVSQPPLLTAKPRKSPHNESKPGQRSLLLKEIISENLKSGIGQTSTAKRKLGETVKRKNLTPVQQLMTDTQRQNAIDLYRQMKNKKIKEIDT